MSVNEGGRDYKVLFAASTSVNPGTRFVKNPSYPTILEDFRKTFQVLESLQPDIFVSGHASFFNLKAKRAKMNPENPAAAFVDQQGYRTLIAEKKKTFESAVAKEQAAR
jgi:metallo-beta-lactamase class B